jgi:hypothetical protein
LIPASQHADQFPPIAEDEDEFFWVLSVSTIIKPRQSHTICQVEQLGRGREHLGRQLRRAGGLLLLAHLALGRGTEGSVILLRELLVSLLLSASRAVVEG